jgi:uncharacterized membrane protein YecN with MAPEG domain
MEYATLIVLLALVQYGWFSMRVGMAREKYNISAPSCAGDETWERLFRVQQNTLEQLIVFVPACSKTRVLGMILTLLPNVVLILGALFGLIKGML